MKISAAGNGGGSWIGPATMLGAAALGLVLLAAPFSRAGEDGPDWLPETVFASVIDGDLKQGFTLRADTWDGTLPTGETKPIRQQFFKGNDYRFYASTRVPGATVSLHIYDQDGNLAESRSWKKEEGTTYFAGANIQPKSTASYYLILKVDKSPELRTAWAMAYSYK